MSNDVDNYMDPENPAMALFLTSCDGDELTDMLVAALNDAFRILHEDAMCDTVH